MDPTIRELLRSKSTLVIEQQDTLVSIRDDSGWLRYLLLSGKPMLEELGQGGPAVVKSSWKKAKLVTERKLGGGGVYRESYSLDPKTGRLRLETEFRGKGMDQSVKRSRTYEREGKTEGAG